MVLFKNWVWATKRLKGPITLDVRIIICHHRLNNVIHLFGIITMAYSFSSSFQLIDKGTQLNNYVF